MLDDIMINLPPQPEDSGQEVPVERKELLISRNLLRLEAIIEAECALAERLQGPREEQAIYKNRRLRAVPGEWTERLRAVQENIAACITKYQVQAPINLFFIQSMADTYVDHPEQAATFVPALITRFEKSFAQKCELQKEVPLSLERTFSITVLRSQAEEGERLEVELVPPARFHAYANDRTKHDNRLVVYGGDFTLDDYRTITDALIAIPGPTTELLRKFHTALLSWARESAAGATDLTPMFQKMLDLREDVADSFADAYLGQFLVDVFHQAVLHEFPQFSDQPLRQPFE